MSRFEILRDAGWRLLHSKRLWLIQVIGNALLFAIFAGWLLLPVASDLHLLLNGAIVIVLVAAALVLHGGTLNFYSEQNRGEKFLALGAFRRAVRNLLAIAASAFLLFAFWALLDSTESWQIAFPFYLRSLLPEFIRMHVGVWGLQIFVEGIVFTVRWIGIPGLLLPLLLESSNVGFRAFGKPGRAALRNSASRPSYWLVLLLAAFVGCLAPLGLLDWTPEFKNPTVHIELISLIARLGVSYVLMIASWLVVCSIVGRFGSPATVAGSDAARNSAA